MKFVNPCLFLCLGFCSAQDGYQNNANIPLDNIGLIHDIFGTGSLDYEGQDVGTQENSGQSQSFEGQFLGVQPGVVRPDVPGHQYSGNFVEEQRPARVASMEENQSAAAMQGWV